jgi:hypothetical protein
MPAKEEEVKKYRDAAIGNAAIVEDQYSSLGPHHLDLKFPINRWLKFNVRTGPSTLEYS